MPFRSDTSQVYFFVPLQSVAGAKLLNQNVYLDLA